MYQNATADCTSIGRWLRSSFSRRLIDDEGGPKNIFGIEFSDAVSESVIVIERCEKVRGKLCRFFAEKGFRVKSAPSFSSLCGDMLQAIRLLSVADVVVWDAEQGDFDTNIIRLIKKKNPKVKILMTTDNPSLREAVESVKAGAFDYLKKPLQSKTLEKTLARAFHRSSFSRFKARIDNHSRKQKPSLTLIPGGLMAT